MPENKQKRRIRELEDQVSELHREQDSLSDEDRARRAAELLSQITTDDPAVSDAVGSAVNWAHTVLVRLAEAIVPEDEAPAPAQDEDDTKPKKKGK